MNGSMRDDLMKRVCLAMMVLGIVCSFFLADQDKAVYGGELTNDMKKMQEQLNNQVLSKPFSVADEAQVKSYIADAQRRGEVPQP
jgi:hypothetical protein